MIPRCRCCLSGGCTSSTSRRRSPGRTAPRSCPRSGADVVKVERPDTGDDGRAWGPPFWNGESAMFLAVNAGKRSLAVSLRDERGRDAVLRLAERADVFLQSLRPGLAERIGLGPEEVRGRNPRIVYCSVGAYGNTGPLAHEPGYDALMQAAGGLISMTGEPGRPGVRVGPRSSTWAPGYGRRSGRSRRCSSASAPERARSWTPRSTRPRSATSAITSSATSRTARCQGVRAPASRWSRRTRSSRPGTASSWWRAGTTGCSPRSATSRVARPRRRRALPHESGPGAESRGTRRDRLGPSPRGRRGALARAAHRRRSSGGAGRGRRRRRPRRQTDTLGFMQPLEHERIPDLRLPALPLSFDHERATHRSAPPAVGEHTAEILGEAGYAAEEIAQLAPQASFAWRSTSLAAWHTSRRRSARRFGCSWTTARARSRASPRRSATPAGSLGAIDLVRVERGHEGARRHGRRRQTPTTSSRSSRPSARCDGRRGRARLRPHVPAAPRRQDRDGRRSRR